MSKMYPKSDLNRKLLEKRQRYTSYLTQGDEFINNGKMDPKLWIPDIRSVEEDLSVSDNLVSQQS